MNSSLLSREKGFTILEVVFAVSILAIGIMGYTALKTSNMYSWFFSKNMSQAVQLTGSNLEALWMAGYNDAGWLSAAVDPPHSKDDQNAFGDKPIRTAGDFAASDVEWTVRDHCPTEMTKMIVYTTKWSDNHNSVTITQVQVRP